MWTEVRGVAKKKKQQQQQQQQQLKKSFQIDSDI